MTSTPPVTLCIINRNGARHLPETLAALHAQHWRFAEVLLVDDASDDASSAIAAEAYPDIRIVQRPSRGGPGAARNTGRGAATNDLILFLDNDVRLEVDTAERLIGHLRAHAGALLVAPRVVHAHDPDLVQYDSADCHFLGMMSTRNADRRLDGAVADPAITTSMVSACFLFDRALWPDASPFDESLGFNLEDHDFGVRATIAGHVLWVLPAARVRHGTGTPGLSYRSGDRATDTRLFHLTRNRWIVVAKGFSWRALIVLGPALLLLEILQAAWLVGQGRAAVWWHAVRSLMDRRGPLYRQRRDVQRSRRVGDASVLRGGPLPLTKQVRAGPITRVCIAVVDIVLRGYWCLARHLLKS